jgi:hypothetical protein
MGGQYCSACGQKALHGRLDAHELLHEAWHAFTHADAGLLRLVRDLAVRPRDAYTAYFAGARKRYANPVLFLLLIEGLYIVGVTLVMQHHFTVLGRTPQLEAELLVRQADKLKYLIGLPIITLLTWVLVRPRFTVAEVAVFWLFGCGFATLIELLSFPVLYGMPAQREVIQASFGWAAGLTLAWHVLTVFGRPARRYAIPAVAAVLLSVVALNYSMRVVYLLKRYDVDMSIAAALRDSFGL